MGKRSTGKPHSLDNSDGQPPVRQGAIVTACKPDQTPPWKIWLEWSTFTVGVLGLIVFWLQWNAAKKANEINGENFRAQQRAWVGLDTLKSTYSPLSADKPLEWSLMFKNYGSSPAQRLRWHIRSYPPVASPQFAKIKDDLRELKVDAPNQPELVLFNGDELTNNAGSQRFLTGDDVTGINARVLGLVIGGKVLYYDIFGELHTYTFCRILNPPRTEKYVPGFLTCPIGDETN